MPYKRTNSNHTYILSVERSHAGVGFDYLTSSIYYNNSYIDKIILMEINPNEVLLNAGRFKNYTTEEQTHAIQIVLRRAGLYEVTHNTRLILDYIGNSITGKWNLAAWVTNFNSDGDLVYDFTFEHKNEAMALKIGYS